MCRCVFLRENGIFLKARWTLLNFIFGLWCGNTMNIYLSLYIVYCNRITVKLKSGEFFEWKPCDLGIHSYSFQYPWQVFFPPLRLFLCTAPTWAPSISAAPAFDYTCLCTKWKSILFTMFRWHFKMTFILKNWAGKAKHPINCWFCALRRF